MARVATTMGLGRRIESLFDRGSVVGLTDRQLLERFNTDRGADAEAAFAALVSRHGPMVLRVCLQLLRDQHHAEDAFQAVFLVLARRARSIHDPDRLANWLYGTAVRTARCTKTRIDHRRKREGGPFMNTATRVKICEPTSESISAEQSVLDREQAAILHEEIGRLPQSFRLPIVLCYFEGLSLNQAASHLRWPEGTLRSRLARARQKLERSLARRGLTFSSVGLLGVLAPDHASAQMPAQLCDATARAAVQFAAGKAVGGALSASAAAMAIEVLKTMIYYKVKMIALVACTLGLTALGTGVLGHSLGMIASGPDVADDHQPPVALAPVPKQEAPTPKAKAEPNSPGPGRMFVVGRVLDPSGKPVSNASVMVYARPKLRKIGRMVQSLNLTFDGHAASDAMGHFRLDTTRGSSAEHDDFAAAALAPGYGVGWADLDPDAQEPTAEITLQPEQVIQGRLFDLKGQPAEGVTVSVGAIERIEYQGADPLSRRVEGVIFTFDHPNVLEAWPKPMITDSQGRFTLHGVGRGLKAHLSVIDPRYALERIEVDTDSPSEVKTVTLALQPSKIINGRVTYADTAKPAAHAMVAVASNSSGQSTTRVTYFETDADGRFHANPYAGDRFTVSARPPAGVPYLGYSAQPINWPKGAIEQSVNLALPPGVLIQGKVTEAGSGKPVVGASVNFLQFQPRDARSLLAETATDGSFTIGVKPGSGHLIVLAPSDDYQFVEIGNRTLTEGKPGGARYYAHAFVACEPKSGENLTVNVSLPPGVTVKGRIFGPDGQPVNEPMILTPLAAKDESPLYRFWRGGLQTYARNGHFQLHGLGAKAETQVSFLEPKLRLGTTIKVSSKLANNGPIDVRLEPCGQAKARLIDPAGQPVARFKDPRMISMVLVPGPSRISRNKADEGRLASVGDVLIRIDPLNYEKPPVSDAQGSILFPALVPGATYRLQDRTTARATTGVLTRKEFTAKAGETLDLGDIVIEKPGAPS